MKKGAGGRPFLWSDDQAGQVCGDEAWLSVTDPRTERGMEDYRLDQREDPERHPAAVDRLLGRRRRSVVEHSGGEHARPQGRRQALGRGLRRRRQHDKRVVGRGTLQPKQCVNPVLNGL
jgi:hypothetical protein